MNELTWKTSTVFVAIGEQTKVYRNLEEMSYAMRRQLSERTKGWHSATIMIADQRGRDVLVQALRGEGSRSQPRPASSVAARGLIAEAEKAANSRLLPGGPSSMVFWRRVREVALLTTVGLALWLAIFGR